MVYVSADSIYFFTAFDRIIYDQLALPLNEHIKSWKFDRDSVEKFILEKYPDHLYKKLDHLGHYIHIVKEAYVKYSLRQIRIPGFSPPKIASGASKNSPDTYTLFSINKAGNVFFVDYLTNKDKSELDDLFVYRGMPIGVEIGKITNRRLVSRKRRMLSVAYGEPSYIFRFSFGIIDDPQIERGVTNFWFLNDQGIYDLAQELFQRYNNS